MINWISVDWSKSPPTACTLLFCNVNHYGGSLTLGVYNPASNTVYTVENIYPISYFTHWAEINMPGE